MLVRGLFGDVSDRVAAVDQRAALMTDDDTRPVRVDRVVQLHAATDA